MEHMYLDNLDEYLNDENRIVTYRWLSLTLNVSSNVAKQMLFHYYDDQRKAEKEAELHITYLLTGLKYEEEFKQDVHKVCVVRDENLEKEKGKLKEVLSVHVYSIQRARLKDLHVLYGVDVDKIRENATESSKYSSIRCPSAGTRVRVSKPQDTTTPSLEPKTQTKMIPSNDDDKSTDNKENKSCVVNQKPKPVPKMEPKGAIASMFANVTKKMNSKPPQQPKKAAPKSKPTPKGGLSAFLTKGPSKRNEKQPSPQKRILTPKVEVKEEEEEVKEEEEEVKEEEIKVEVKEEEIKVEVKEEEIENAMEERSPRKKHVEEKKTTKAPQRKPPTTKRGKRKSSSSAAAPSENSKRRRILTLESSSESSDEEEEEETPPMDDECPIPYPFPSRLDSDDDDVIPATPDADSQHVSNASGKRRCKKTVDKTYENEEGYFVTKKVVEFLTDSEEETPLPSRSPTRRSSPTKGSSPTKRSSPKKSPKKVSPSTSKGGSSAKNVQSSITSFFQKK